MGSDRVEKADITVLVVDDDPVSRLVLCHMLQQQGFATEEADSAEAALAMYRPALALILCDYIMPGGSGLDLLEALPASRPPFVLLTGELRREDFGDPRVNGLDGYLTKPVGSEELRAATLSALPKSPATN